EDSTLREHTCFHIDIKVLGLDVHVVVFRKVGHPIVQTIRRERRTNENPSAESCGQYQLAVTGEMGGGTRRLRGSGARAEESNAPNDGNSGECCNQISFV